MNVRSIALVIGVMLIGTPTITGTARANSTHTCQGNADCSTTTNNYTTTNQGGTVTNRYNPSNTNSNVQNQQQNIRNSGNSTNTNTVTATGGTVRNSGNSSNTNNNSNAGNTQVVNQTDRLQAPAVSSFVAASGPCTGAAGGGGLSLVGVGVSMNAVTLEGECQKREAARIGFASGNPEAEALALKVYESLDAVRSVMTVPVRQTSPLSVVSDADPHPEVIAVPKPIRTVGSNR